MSDPDIEWRVDLENGKYTLLFYSGGGMEALRYNEPWRELTGDNLIYFMGVMINDLSAEIKRLSNSEKSSIDDVPEISDTDRIDFLQRILIDEGTYTGKCILRKSSRGRGFRLHETSMPGGSTDVRQIIDNIMRLKPSKKE